MLMMIIIISIIILCLSKRNHQPLDSCACWNYHALMCIKQRSFAPSNDNLFNLLISIKDWLSALSTNNPFSHIYKRTVWSIYEYNHTHNSNLYIHPNCLFENAIYLLNDIKMVAITDSFIITPSLVSSHYHQLVIMHVILL